MDEDFFIDVDDEEAWNAVSDEPGSYGVRMADGEEIVPGFELEELG